MPLPVLAHHLPIPGKEMNDSLAFEGSSNPRLALGGLVLQRSVPRWQAIRPLAFGRLRLLER
jgi:hypothetical protein